MRCIFFDIWIDCSVSGVCSLGAVTSPIWVVKTRLQLQRNPLREKPAETGAQTTVKSSSTTSTKPYKGIFDAFKTVYREEGARGYFKGLSASYLGVSETIIQFVLYEKLKKLALKRYHSKLHEDDVWKAQNSGKRIEDESLPSLWALGMGSCAKLFASSCTYPHEVLRTRLREQRHRHIYKGITTIFAEIIKFEGVRGLYGGIGPHLLRTVPNAGILFFVVELVVGGEV
eukprot:gb/GECG01009471.1/.p1 GENE.gb/GECG01009471.1/~~gb/GECG01009471.1/.p1  ORF type:complete len:229 (+),score=16.77 gb/GECG01009471.1/:1-687(+)